MADDDSTDPELSADRSPVLSRLPAVLLFVIGIACAELLKRLTEASWEATVLVVLLLGPWTVLLAVRPQPSNDDKWIASGATAALVLSGAIVWGLIAWLPTPDDGNCSSEYEGACVPVDAADVNCDEIPVRGFRSVGSDPYGLDSDEDGTACE